MNGLVVQFSDVHFGVEHSRACEAALQYAHEVSPDLVLITGDITQQGFTREFEAAAEWIRSMPDPVFVTVGNHDVPYWSAVDRLLWPWRRFEKITGHPAHDHEFKTSKIMVRGVATARGWQARLNWSKGVIDLDQTRRAAEALRQAPVGALRILACHHPLIEMIGSPVTGDVKRGDEAALIFAEAGVDLITTGHTHVPFALPIPLADHFSSAVGCGTLSHRERGVPPSFNRIEWSGTEINVTVVAWDGHVFAPAQTWSLPRRQDTRRAATAPDPARPGPMEKAAI